MDSRTRALRQSVRRGGPVVVALLFGAALVGSSALWYRDATRATEVLTERHGGSIYRRVRQELGDGQPQPTALARALETSRDLGLTYVAYFKDGRPLLEAGQTNFPGTEPAVFKLVTNGRQARMAAPVKWGARGPEVSASSLVHVIEFKLDETNDIAHRALLGLWLSSGAALLLTSAALVLWHAERRAQRMALELDKQKHLAALGTMSAVLAHEIRNPLAALKGHAQLLAERTAEPKTETRVRLVVEEAVRLETLTNDLLDFARSGAVRPAAASPIAVLERAVAATIPERIEQETVGAPASWTFDTSRMEQVLINLLNNALGATPDGEKVTATIEPDGSDLVFSVRDRGPGVPASESARIFEPFHTTKQHGTGLGLAVCKRIVELHGGRIEIRDAPGGGALFRVTLPRWA